MTLPLTHQWEAKAKSICFETRPFINGDYYQSNNCRVFQTNNPASNNELAIFPDSNTTIIDRAVSSAREAFQSWRQVSPKQRKALLLTVADKVVENKNSLALFDCLEMGMPITQALQKVDSAVDTIRYYAESIDKTYGDLAPSDPTSTLAVSIPQPRGVVGVIAPWNSPLVVAISAVAPALAAGNTVVVKPSEQTPSSILKLAEIAAQAGLPAGALNVAPGLGITTGAALANHQDVNLIHFTGSTQVGRQLMQYAGQSNGKPMMLELGGKSPQLIFEDAAELPNLGAVLAQSAFINTGQICVAKTRLLVHENIKDHILKLIRQETKKYFTVGNPLHETTTLGPIASEKQFERVNHYLNLGGNEGAKAHILEVAGDMPEAGNFMPPVVFDQADNAMRIAQEEIFGPVLSLITFKTDDEAIQLANNTQYGLAATAWTKDLNRAHRLARDLEAGSVDICATTNTSSHSSGLSGEPFKASGFGVIGGLRGLAPYTCLKAIQFIT